MERLMHQTVHAISADFDVTLIGPRGCAGYCPHGVRAIECPAKPLGFLIWAFVKGLLHCAGRRHHIVLGGSGLVSPITYLLVKSCRGTSAVFVHGLDLVVANPVYQFVFVPFIRRHDAIICNSSNTRNIALEKGCRSDRLTVIHPGTSIPSDEDLKNTESIRSRFALGESKLLLFVGRIVRRKGLSAFLRQAWPSIERSYAGVKLLIIGDTPDNALLKDPNEARQVQTAIEVCTPGSILCLGEVDDDLLLQCYAAADALVFPLIEVEGDVEGFGMVAVEAAACGTPTVAFRVGGVVDAIADGVSGRLVTPGDYRAFAAATLALLAGDAPTAHECRAHAGRFEWQEYRRQLLSLLYNDSDTGSARS